MEIIIIGDGKVGYSLAESLSNDEHDVTIIDKDDEKLSSALENLNVCCIKGSGVNTQILLEAGVREADLLIAVTNIDELNMVSCLIAKKLGAKHTIARIRDNEYANDLTEIQKDLGLDLVINPERAVAGEISKLLEFPVAQDVEFFAKGRVEMVEIKITADMSVVGMSMIDVSKKISDSILIGAILRRGEVIIPKGSDIIQVLDIVYIIGHPSQVFKFCTNIGMHIPEISHVMIIGGSRAAHYLARYLDEIDVKTKIIERNHKRCVELAEQLPNTLIINGDATDSIVLKSENLDEMDGFVALTGNDEENIMMALLAKKHGASKAVAQIDKTGYFELVDSLSIDNFVSPKMITAEHILRYVRGLNNAVDNPVNTLYRIIEDQAEVIEFTAKQSDKCIKIPLKSIKLRKDILVAVLVRGNRIIIPHGGDVIKSQDTVILITKGQRLSMLDDILQVQR